MNYEEIIIISSNKIQQNFFQLYQDRRKMTDEYYRLRKDENHGKLYFQSPQKISRNTAILDHATSREHPGRALRRNLIRIFKLLFFYLLRYAFCCYAFFVWIVLALVSVRIPTKNFRLTRVFFFFSLAYGVYVCVYVLYFSKTWR